MLLILANIFRVLAGLFDLMAANTNDTKKIYLYNGIYNFLLGLQYTLLNAIAGAISSFAAILRNIIFDKNKNTFFALVIYLVFTIIINIPAYDGIISILPIIMVFMYTIAIYKADLIKIKYTVIITCAIEIIYDIYYNAYMGAILCVINIVVVIISLIRLKTSKVKK